MIYTMARTLNCTIGAKLVNEWKVQVGIGLDDAFICMIYLTIVRKSRTMSFLYGVATAV